MSLADELTKIIGPISFVTVEEVERILAARGQPPLTDDEMHQVAVAIGNRFKTALEQAFPVKVPS